MTEVTIFRRACALALALALICSPGNALAQHDHHQPPSDTAGWTWSAMGQAFLTANLQERRFRDFHQVESQNWLMGVGTRRLGPSTLALHGMASLEPFTLRRLGSAQVFQTGETLDNAPLIDYQHPHDLIMGLSARVSTPLRGATLHLGGGLVDAPALGPTAFMHRASASSNPTVPLAHHQLDATHITHGVVTAGVTHRAWTGEASLFRGREPDEDRLDLDLGALDSWSGRISWRRGGLMAQISGARLREPDAIELGDVTRLTSSIEYTGAMFGRLVATTVAWGENRAMFGVENAYLAEAVTEFGPRGSIYVRGELVEKHILSAGGRHPPGLSTPAHLLARRCAHRRLSTPRRQQAGRTTRDRRRHHWLPCAGQPRRVIRPARLHPPVHPVVIASVVPPACRRRRRPSRRWRPRPSTLPRARCGRRYRLACGEW